MPTSLFKDRMENDKKKIKEVQENDEYEDIEEWLAQEEISLDQLTAPFYNNLKLPYKIVTCFLDSIQKDAFLLENNDELRSISEIPSPFNSIFKFAFFNKIQSICLNDAYYENNNLVISAPTGSGKTVIMELAIIRALLHSGSDSKIIYMAPTKSLCSERVKDWQTKFKPFNIDCKEFTGDTHNNTISTIRKTTIIVTTPEKWDSMTRHWIDHRQLMRLINLFLIDEVHILNEKRGACLEACVSRMKTMDNNRLRFIAVSATVPNLNDIATWLDAKRLPIRLDRFVYAYSQHEENMFLFDRRLDWKLLDMIQKHSNNKPVLIFCSTRKSAEQSCNTILKMMDKKGIHSLRNTRERSNLTFKNKILPKLVEKGIAFHHAGLDLSDRSQIETLFSNRYIRVIATTSTLAVGVNLPTHLVIVKSTQGYQNGGLTEYSDIDLLQMIGRAGRPGLDTSGCVVILTTLQMEQRYKSLVSGTTNLESRVTKNPIHYKLSSGSISTNHILQEICVKDLKLLKENNLIQAYSNDHTFKPTPYGLAMDKFYIKFPTMVKLLQAENPNSVRDTLDLLSKCCEEFDMIRFNPGEKQFLNALKNHANIRFPLTKISSTADKVFMLLQCVFGDISLYNNGSGLLAIEASTVMNHLSRVTKCLIDCSVQEKNPIKLKYALELYQNIQAKLWTTSPYVARQIDGIGSQLVKTLAQANLISFDQLRQCDPGRLEMILHRNPPFGTKIKKQIDAIPIFILDVEQESNRDVNKQNGNDMITLNIRIGIENEHANTGKHGKKHHVLFWLDTSEKELIDFRRIHLIRISKLLQKRQLFNIKIELKSPITNINCHLQSEDYVGIDVQKELTVNVDPRKFITVMGQSNMMNQNQEKLETVVDLTNEDIDGFEDDDKIDPNLWDILAVATSTISIPNKFNKNDYEFPFEDNLQQTQVLKEHDMDNYSEIKSQQQKPIIAPCKHRCKNKEDCAHKCCKRNQSSLNMNKGNGLKRKAAVDEDDSEQFSSKLYLKKLKTVNDEIKDITYTETSNIQNKSMEIEQFPVFSTRGLHKPNESNNIVPTIKDEDEDMFVDLFDFDNNEVSFDSIIQSAALESKLSNTTETTNSLDARHTNTMNIECTAPTRTCDQLWEQVGEMTQKAFENFESDRQADTFQKKGILAISYNNECAISEDTTQDNPIEFKSASLSEWIKNNVEIIH
ncbi:Sec63 Brl domain-containing protein [Cokeromyces recurvatus]|uniref:Sec63 Brl domain-containing protein n=1 Tax=Cokeromyces recurvatus TaxID=90255 RepID=UPI00221ED9FF|nr:Sec63 Brl domain-containing protein [Cokeromyces recurvatus]KAI7899419.1 Sec63 Brl domain-containing protein [Cokeromyces recurvatus]